MWNTYKKASRDEQKLAKNMWCLFALVFSMVFIALYRQDLSSTTKHKFISPLPDKVYASEIIPTPTINLSVREKIIVSTMETFGSEHLEEMENLVFAESSFNPGAINPTSGSCGLFQALPCEKMDCSLKDIDCQIKWGLSYIKARYETPTKAWKFWLNNNWY